MPAELDAAAGSLILSFLNRCPRERLGAGSRGSTDDS